MALWKWEPPRVPDPFRRLLLLAAAVWREGSRGPSCGTALSPPGAVLSPRVQTWPLVLEFNSSNVVRVFPWVPRNRLY